MAVNASRKVSHISAPLKYEELSGQLQKELNKLTIKNRYPLPRIEDLVDQLRKACPFLKSKEEQDVHLIFSVRVLRKREVVCLRESEIKTSKRNDTGSQSEALSSNLDERTSAERLQRSIGFGTYFSILKRMEQWERMIQTLVDYNDGPLSPMLWAEIREGSLIGPELVQEMTDKVVVIKEKLSATRDCQKSYADSGRKMTEYEVGDNGLLKVSPGKGVMRFGKKGKLAPRYIRPFEILERIGLVAYRLRLPEELIGVHDTFHVSNLKKCLGNANLHVPLNEIKIDKTLRFVEEPIEIMDRKVKSLKRNRIPLVKVHWNSKCGPEFTWEREDYMKSKYPQLFVDRAVEPTS
ncbi:hypothetical protein Tco_0233619 [Tanacetum coccineum]